MPVEPKNSTPVRSTRTDWRGKHLVEHKDLP